jgi:tetratricopeptide (TPR) repeat protein
VNLIKIQEDRQVLTIPNSTESEALVKFEVYKNTGNLCVKSGEFDLAEDFYNKAFAIKPNSDDLMVNYGALAIQRGNKICALEKFRSALNINIKNDKAWIGLALIHNDLGDYELAWGNLKTALEINPKNKIAVELCCHWARRDEKHSLVLDCLDQLLKIEQAICEEL